MKDLRWVNSSKKDLAKLPTEVKQAIGYALWLAQMNCHGEHTKQLKGLGTGIHEIISNHDKNTYRAVYVANFKNTIYVLHVFQKKSKQGIKTPKEDIDTIKSRLKQLKQHIVNKAQQNE